MTTTESIDFYLRFVKQSHTELINSINLLVQSLVTENIHHKKDITIQCKKAAGNLESGLAIEDRPQWLTPLIQSSEKFINHASNGNANNLIKFILKYEKQIKQHQWNTENKTDQAFDFDAIYTYYKSESRLPELFEEIIKILEEIKSSGEIDSIAMINALSKVIATLQKNKDGSYFSMQSAWSFLTTFLKHYFITEISQIPVLGSAVQALEKTVTELSEELNNVDESVRLEMNKTVGGQIKPLDGKSGFNFLTYDCHAVKTWPAGQNIEEQV